LEFSFEFEEDLSLSLSMLEIPSTIQYKRDLWHS
jgi:hypothetical protein